MTYTPSQLQEFLQNIPHYPGTFSGRGIVISGGGSYLASAYLTVKALRHLGSSLPIQLWYLGERELPAVLHPLFTALGVEPVDALEVQKRHPMKTLGGWQNKPFSIIHSPFREVMLIDADNIPLRNPDSLFDSIHFKECGAVFWPDFLSPTPQYWSIKSEAWSLLGLEPRENAEIESGQLLINKEVSWAPLSVTLHMNEHSDFYYERCTYGDKDTFTLSWMVMNVTPYVVPHRPKLLDEMIRLHFTPEGEELFQHGRKWVLPSEKNPTLPSVRLQGECFEWLREFEGVLRSITG